MKDFQETNDLGNGLELAVIGMAGRFPDAPDIDRFWQNIYDGHESVVEYSEQDLHDKGVAQSLIDDPDYVRAGIPFDNMDKFDANFFAYTPRDAEHIDPQHRLFLECAWHALEHAGYIDVKQDEAVVGVYAGCGASVYLIKHLLTHTPLTDRTTVADILGLMSGNSADALVTRVAYKLNLKGPAVAIQTACSSSLMAIHMASQSLLNQECDIALAGGVSLNLLQQAGYLYRSGAIFSQDGHCRAFDAKATGTLLGSGAGIVVLKRLAEAIKDGDTIHAVLKASAANNDGADKIGFTAPSIQGQAHVIQQAQSMADVEPSTITYVEAHGTGTTLGDPIEVAALTLAFGEQCPKQQCALGSVKTNIGHLDAAAGVAGFIKTVMALKHKCLPASLNFQQANPQIDFKNSPFYVNSESKFWPEGTTPRRAGVSSFGIGGTNVHVVLEEYREDDRRTFDKVVASESLQAPYALVLSGQTAKTLEMNLQQFCDYLNKVDTDSLAEVSSTLAYGRRHLAHRCVVLARDSQEAVASLTQRPADSFFRGQVRSEPAKMVFMFPGQGAQHVDMGLGLYEKNAFFKATVDDCCQQLKQHMTLDLRELLFPLPEKREAAAHSLMQTQYTQAALFVMEYALAKLWMSWGIKPVAMIGHSVGEYVAACLAGVLTLSDALFVIAKRGQLLQATEPGAMLALALSETAAQEYVSRGCQIAAVNAEQLCVLAGSIQLIDSIQTELTQKGIMTRRLHVSHAFHSEMVEPILPAFREVLSHIPLSAPRIPFISNLNGSWVSAEEVTKPDYWLKHIRQTVRFHDGISELLKKTDHILLEVGPGQTLLGLIRHHALLQQRPVFCSQGSVQKPGDSLGTIYQCLAQMWVLGIDVGQSPLFNVKCIRRIPLPLYAFDHQSYWLMPKGQDQVNALPSHLASNKQTAYLYTPAWKRQPLNPVTTAQASETILLLARRDELPASLKAALLAQGHQVITVFPADKYQKIDAHHYEICITQETDFVQLWQDIKLEGLGIKHIFHAWCLETRVQSDGLDGWVKNELLALIYLIRLLSHSNNKNHYQISLLFSQLEDVIGTENLCPHKALLSGLCKVINQEYTHIHCKIIDVESVMLAENKELIISDMTAELFKQDGEALVAYRGHDRWVKYYDPIQSAPTSTLGRLQKQGVYLITGGLGGIGLQLAEYLTEQWQASLMLVGRHRHQEQEERIDALRKQGARIEVWLADIADKVQTQRAVEQAYQVFGTLNGIIHAAGISETCFIHQVQDADIYPSVAAKVLGTDNILQAIQGKNVDFVVLISSLATVLGGMGKGLYAAANAYLDAIATLHRGNRRPWVIAMNWDGWRDIGMAAHRQLPEHIGIRPEQGMALFEAVLTGRPYSQVVISSLALENRMNFKQEDLLELQEQDSLSGQARSYYPRPALSVGYVQPQDELEENLAQIWADILGITGLGVDDNLFELGGDSLMAIQLLAKVKAIYGVEVKPADFFQVPSIATIAYFIESALLEQLDGIDGEKNLPSSSIKE